MSMSLELRIGIFVSDPFPSFSSKTPTHVVLTASYTKRETER